MQQMASIKSMQAQLMLAAYGSIKEIDIQEIVQAQLAKAKAGDAKALDFVMKYLLGQDGGKTEINHKQEIIVGNVEQAARAQKAITSGTK